MPYICPICQNPLILQQASRGYYCKNKHHFDIAKEGYLNLLPVQHKKTKEPGDSRAMMRSRRRFLETGFYLPLAEAISTIIDAHLQQDNKTRILDLGCGEGYYSRQIERLSKKNEKLELHGADIAKNAIFAAAKKQPNAHFIVASNKHLPYADNYFDLLLRVYAPSSDSEINRLLKPEGLLLMVTPGPRHLWQLKEFIYKEVKEHTTEVVLPQNFEVLDSKKISYRINPDQEQRMALLQMTPFAWRAKGESRHNIQHAKNLDIEVDFILTLGLKKSGTGCSAIIP